MNMSNHQSVKENNLVEIVICYVIKTTNMNVDDVVYLNLPLLLHIKLLSQRNCFVFQC